MTTKPIATEEHFWTPELRELRRGHDVLADPELGRRLSDLGELRIAEMDEAGVEMQVISHVEPATQNFAPAEAVRLAVAANDLLHQAVCAHPDRFAGFAALPTSDPAAAARELDRAVNQLGFKGAMIHGLTRGSFPDDKTFWPIFATAEGLGVPLYLHPATPHPDVIEAYYSGYPSMVRVGHGFTSEMSAIATRLVLSEVFEAFPSLQIILGHLGEAIPFLLPRVDRYVSRQMKGGRTFQDTIRRNFYFTTGGKFTHTALQCTVEAIGIERLMFAVDWPFHSNLDGVAFIATAPISDEAKAKIFSGNARALLRI
ncbi:MAG TPA: amidohydrolase family protein [Xanthobacteraceae bacterium]|nr:amidohydrolase family protein [Xanthobacteraceae bacterium]